MAVALEEDKIYSANMIISVFLRDTSSVICNQMRKAMCAQTHKCCLLYVRCFLTYPQHFLYLIYFLSFVRSRAVRLWS